MTSGSTSGSTVVVGAGVGGLTVAYHLARAGRRVCVLEASRWLGGVVGRHKVAGLELDAGADAYAVARPAVPELLAELDLTELIREPSPVGAWVYDDGLAAPLPVGGHLGIPADPRRPDVVAVLGADGAARAAQDLTLPPDVGWSPNGVTTLGALVRARMGDLAVDRLVEPVVGGVHSADPDLLDVDVIAPRLRELFARTGTLAGSVVELRGGAGQAGSAVAGLEGGMHTLVLALVEEIEAAGGTIERRCPVRSVTRTAGGFRLTVGAGDTGPGDTGAGATGAGATGAGAAQIEAEQVVLAVPGAALGQLVAGLDPAAAQRLAAARTCDILLATLVVDRPELDALPRGTGLLVSARTRGVQAKALTHATAKWPFLAEAAGPGRHVLRLSYGRDGQGIPAAPDSLATALRDASTLLGFDVPAAALVDSAMVRWRYAMPRADTEHAERVAAARALAGDGLDFAGSFVAGTGLAAVVDDARRTAGRLG